jgi:hypothetical protein
MTWKHAEMQPSLWSERPAQADESSKQIFEAVFRTLRPRTPIPQFEIRFRRYVDVNNVIRVRDGKVVAGLSDLLETAPRTVIEAIACILLCKLFRKAIPEHYEKAYRRYLNRKSVRTQVQAMRRDRGRKWIGSPAGSHFHLEEMFDALNLRYFDGSLQRPRLTWSRSASRTVLGHFDQAHNTIVISKIFDRPQMPRYVVEYILFHEMLHLKHPVIHHRNRRCFHSALFRSEEKRFPHFAEAKRLLDRL